jgi:hypothetical protein
VTETRDFLTVEEAARVLRIGRTAAYLAAKRYRETDGAEGLPCIRVGGSLRVPRRQLEALAGGAIEAEGTAGATSTDRPDEPASTRRHIQSQRPRPDDQRTLPLTS